MPSGKISDMPKEASEHEKQRFEEAELLYRFVILYYARSNKRKDYGYGPAVTMVEIHTATRISDHPGITVSQLAAYYSRTNSAMSQLVTKLEKKGLVERRMTSDLRNTHLYPTEAGSRLCRMHKQYDGKYAEKTRKALSSRCSEEEIDTFFKVLKEYADRLELRSANP